MSDVNVHVLILAIHQNSTFHVRGLGLAPFFRVLELVFEILVAR